MDLRKNPALYQVGRGEQGVLLVQPYKSEILPLWRFKNIAAAKKSASAILRVFNKYKAGQDFVGMDMARKFLQMGYTRARRYANHPGGKKYDGNGRVLPFKVDEIKARVARVFCRAWKKVEADPEYAAQKARHKVKHG